jgi:hypothetical protein
VPLVDASRLLEPCARQAPAFSAATAVLPQSLAMARTEALPAAAAVQPRPARNPVQAAQAE